MFFGATSFSATTFAGVGIQNVVVLATGKKSQYWHRKYNSWIWNKRYRQQI